MHFLFLFLNETFQGVLLMMDFFIYTENLNENAHLQHSNNSLKLRSIPQRIKGAVC